MKARASLEMEAPVALQRLRLNEAAVVIGKAKLVDPSGQRLSQQATWQQHRRQAWQRQQAAMVAARRCGIQKQQMIQNWLFGRAALTPNRAVGRAVIEREAPGVLPELLTWLMPWVASDHQLYAFSPSDGIAGASVSRLAIFSEIVILPRNTWSACCFRAVQVSLQSRRARVRRFRCGKSA